MNYYVAISDGTSGEITTIPCKTKEAEKAVEAFFRAFSNFSGHIPINIGLADSEEEADELMDDWLL